MIPSSTDELTPAWFTEALGEPVDDVEILDAHSGTTCRARIGVEGVLESASHRIRQAAAVRPRRPARCAAQQLAISAC